MAIEITSRHMHATEEIQKYAREKAEELMEAFPSIENIHVILDHVKRQGVAEVIVHARHHIRATAKDAGPNFRGCIDAAFEKCEKQLRKTFDKLKDRKK